ncbi:hypothetical protein FO519_005197 [Halicephalobus sp. NKZ332]|nr:hypothetical protein FO519_005197 [Halicephalobus sp. NKZ332]
MPRLTGIQSEPNSMDSYSPTNPSRLSSTNPSTASQRLDMKVIPGCPKPRNGQRFSTSGDFIPNVPPVKEKPLRIAVGNAILAATTGMAAVSIESKFSSSSTSSAFSSRPSTSASGISANTIPFSFTSRLSTTMTKNLSLDDDEDEEKSESSFTMNSKIESFPNIPKPRETKNVPTRRNTESALVSSGASIVASRAISKADRFAVFRNSDSSGARNRFEKAPTLTCSSSEERDEDSPGPIYRNSSSKSLPSSTSTSSIYTTTKTQLETDPNVQREVALGKRIGFYRLGKELGAGNFSKVKLGIHCLTKEKVAVKIMDKSKMDQKAQRLLSREVQNMEYLHHPNVIRLFEVIETLSKMYLVMEYAGGGELYTYVHEHGKLTEDQAKPIFAQLVSAVGHLHAKGIVHRDIKAENVIFSQPGWVKLADFGFSCKYEEDSRLSTFCGSPPYAAPELFRDPNYSGPKVDMWALGVTLYFMLVGVTPFRGETVTVLKSNIMMGTYHMPEYLSGFAQYVIQRLLWMDPQQRAMTNELKPSEDILKTDKTEQEVWSKLFSIGIDEEMIKASAGKGAKDAIIGTYRIILYQVRDHVHKIAERNRRNEEQLNKNSKSCTIV